MKREIGYYWIKLISEWEVAEWTGTMWLLSGVDIIFTDNAITIINETKLEPPNE